MEGEDTQDVVELVLALMDRFRRHFLTAVTNVALTPSQAHALLQLDVPLSQRELAHCLHYDASNITAIVDGLEQRGLVERRVDPGDRRVRRIMVTRAGADVLGKLRQRLRDGAPVTGELDGEEQAELCRLLAKVLREASPGGWFGGVSRSSA